MNATRETELAPVRRLLLSRDVDDPDDVLRRVADEEEVSIAAVAAALRHHGIAARVQDARPHDLEGFPLPTLVGLRDGGVALATMVGPRGLWLEAPNQKPSWLSFSCAATHLSGDALDLDPPITPETTFLRAVIAHVRGSPRLRSALVSLGALSVFHTGLQIVGPLLVRSVMDSAVPSGGIGLLGLLAIAVVVLSFHESWAAWLAAKSERFVDARLRSAAVRGAFGHALRLPFPRAQRRGYGELAQDLASSEEATRRLLANLLSPSFDLLATIAYLALLASISLPVATLVFVGGVVIVGMGSVQGSRSGARTLIAIERAEKQRTELDELLTGIVTLKQCAAEREYGGRWYDAFVREQLAAFEATRIDLSNRRNVLLTKQLVTAAVLLWSASRCVEGTMSTGALVLCGQIAASTLAAADRFTVLPLQLRITAYHLRRVERSFAREADEPPGRALSEGGRREGTAIVLDDVWFRHDEDGPWLFRGLSLEVEYGQTTTLGWPSGAGKTTLLRLIAGLYTPNRGTIRVAGRTPARARSSVAYLPQTTVLFEGSVVQNLRLLSGGASIDRIQAAASATGLAEVLASFPMGFDTRLSRRGTNLSGGQRQLLLLTAALASDRPVVLLDESMAHVDSITRARVRMSNLFEGRAVVLVSHDQATSSNVPHERGETRAYDA